MDIYIPMDSVVTGKLKMSITVYVGLMLGGISQMPCQKT